MGEKYDVNDPIIIYMNNLKNQLNIKKIQQNQQQPQQQQQKPQNGPRRAFNSDDSDSNMHEYDSNSPTEFNEDSIDQFGSILDNQINSVGASPSDHFQSIITLSNQKQTPGDTFNSNFKKLKKN